MHYSRKDIIKLSPTKKTSSKVERKFTALFDFKVVDVIEELEAKQIISKVHGEYQTTAIWQGLMSRAYQKLLDEQQNTSDIRIPIVYALMDIYMDNISDETLIPMVAALVWLEEKTSSNLCAYYQLSD